MVVDPRRDHSIRIPRPDLSDKLGSPNACTNCHKDKTNKWAADAIEAWRAGRPSMRKDPHPGELFADARSGKPGSVSALAYMSKDEATNAIYRATALSILEQIPTSEALEAILSGRDDKETIVRNAAAEAAFSRELPDEKRKEIALPLLKDSSKSVRIEAARSIAEFRSSLTGADAEAFDAAAEELIEAQRALADQPGGHMGLGVFYTNLQQIDKAKAAYRAALRIDPGHIPSASNLATILENEGDPETGLRLLRRASEMNTTDPTIWRLLSFHYVRQGNYEAAKEPLETGLEYAPKSVELLYLYGITLNQTKQAALAQGILEMAHSIEPENAEVLFALACVARDRGMKEDAIRYAKKLAPLNPSQAQGLLRELQGGNP